MNEYKEPLDRSHGEGHIQKPYPDSDCHNESRTSTIVEHALRWAEQGVPVFPCKPDKSPLTPHGFHDATTDPEQIETWWRLRPDPLIGFRTGGTSGLTVLDIDRKNRKLPHLVDGS